MTRPVRTLAGGIRLVVILLLASPAVADAQVDPHAGHQMPGPDTPADPNAPRTEPTRPPFIPPVTDADRKAAFPDVDGHAVHDTSINYFVLFDRFEWRPGREDAVDVDARGWVGGDRDRLWFRAGTDGATDGSDNAQVHLLFGRRISRWWDLVGGLRQDFRPGTPRTWAAFGVQGLAPYRFEVEATAYVGASGTPGARLQVEYALLLTNRLILQPMFEAELAGASAPERGVGVGVSTTETGFRLRYELRREVAPYVGVAWSTMWGRTADLTRDRGERTDGARFVTGLRLWF